MYYRHIEIMLRETDILQLNTYVMLRTCHSKCVNSEFLSSGWRVVFRASCVSLPTPSCN
jgi:hypothetical protein